MNYDDVIRTAFYDELGKLARAGALPDFTKLAAVSKEGAPNPFKVGPGIFQRFGQDLMAGGKMLSSPKLVAPGKFAPAGLGSRVAGEVAQSTGHHYAHKSTLGNLVNPLGGAFGGVAEGLTRATGKELSRAGAGVRGTPGRALGAAGTGLQRAAKPMGMAGEVAGLAGLGTALHAPLSVAGAVGGKMVGGLSAAAPAVAEMAGKASHTLAHAAHDVVGTAAQGAADKARRAAGLVRAPVRVPSTGYTLPPPPMAAGAH